MAYSFIKPIGPKQQAGFKKRYLTLVLISLFFGFSSFTKKMDIREIQGQFKFFTTDKIGNVFVLTAKNDIQKFNSSGKKMTEANFKVLGDATLIDASNPLEIYVFYKDQNKLVYFDNMLNYRGETDLYKTLGVNNILAVCRSYDNGIWFFDPDNFKLIKAGKQGDRQSESINLANVTDTAISPQMLVDDGKQVYMKINSGRLMVFDILGNYLKTLSLENFTSFQVRAEQIIYATPKDLFIYNPATFEKDSFKLSEKGDFMGRDFIGIRTENSQIYLHESTKISVISF